MTSLLKIENMFKDFSGLQVLSQINMEVFEGERHALIGPNGAGKSTLFNIISGFYPPSKGRIFFFEKNITGWPAHKIARLGISRSFQIISIFPKMTVYENVRNAIISKLNSRFNWISLVSRVTKIGKESERIIELLGLKNLRDIPASELSYGMQRQLELALTMAQEPTLVMLDEPTAGLNTEQTREIVQLIRQLTEGRTLVIVEHDMEVVFKLADRITVLNNGEILAVGTPDEIQMNENVRKAYLQRIRNDIETR